MKRSKIFATVVLLLSLTACGKSEGNINSNNQDYNNGLVVTASASEANGTKGYVYSDKDGRYLTFEEVCQMYNITSEDFDNLTCKHIRDYIQGLERVEASDVEASINKSVDNYNKVKEMGALEYTFSAEEEMIVIIPVVLNDGTSFNTQLIVEKP